MTPIAPGSAPNEMKAKPASPERIRSMEGLGRMVEDEAALGHDLAN